MSSAASDRLRRLGTAAPDAATALAFLSVWTMPLALGEDAVRTALLIMLVEFILVHAGGFLGMFAYSDGISRRKRVLGILGFACVYLLFVLAFVLIFRAWWPLLVLAWLLLGKLGIVLGRTQIRTDQQMRLMSAWVFSVLFYLGGVFVTVLLPVPQLGMTAELLPQFGLIGEGLWVEQPHRVVAFGTLYFGLCAWLKWRLWART